MGMSTIALLPFHKLVVSPLSDAPLNLFMSLSEAPSAMASSWSLSARDSYMSCRRSV